MKTKALIAKAQGLFCTGKTKQQRLLTRIEKILVKLKKKKQVLKKKLHDEIPGKRRKQFEDELKVISIQRKKGLAILKKLKSGK